MDGGPSLVGGFIAVLVVFGWVEDGYADFAVFVDCGLVLGVGHGEEVGKGLVPFGWKISVSNFIVGGRRGYWGGKVMRALKQPPAGHFELVCCVDQLCKLQASPDYKATTVISISIQMCTRADVPHDRRVSQPATALELLSSLLFTHLHISYLALRPA